MTDSIKTLNGITSGQYYFVTKTHSIYHIDFDEMVVLRFKGAASTDLRGDEEEVTLLGILTCTVGYPGAMVITGLAPNGMETVRYFTEVLSIGKGKWH